MASIFVITGPSAGVGKTTLANRLKDKIPALARIVTATTRPIRPGEYDAVDYYFLSRDEFELRVANGEFVEHVWYNGNQYGTLRAPVEKNMASGISQVTATEYRGALSYKQAWPNVVTIFLVPPSLEALRERMNARKQNSPEQIEQKMQLAKEELIHQTEFDHILINDDLDRAVSELVSIVEKYI